MSINVTDPAREAALRVLGAHLGCDPGTALLVAIDAMAGAALSALPDDQAHALAGELADAYALALDVIDPSKLSKLSEL